MIASVRNARASLLSGSRGRIMNGALVILIVIAAVILATKVVALGPAYFIQILVYGLADGSIYALIALGYTMVYGIVELINFAHGDVFTLGGFISLALLPVFGLSEGVSGAGTILPLIAIFVISMLICGAVNVTIERVAYRPLRHAPRLAPLITAIGMSFVLEGLMFLWRGPFNLHYPNVLPTDTIALGGGATIAYKDIAVVVIALTLMISLSLFVERSKLGKAMRATAQDRDASGLMGIDINRTIAATFFIGAVLAGAGGMIYGLYFNNVTFDLGFSAGLVAFTAAVFGGIGNIQGAAIGGLVIGMIQSLSDGYGDSAWTQVLIFAILILVLVFRPTGIMGMRVPEK
ncbi:MAG: branched-chain amino acid ABC transporter permease [Candidatus Limnocylindrales bacterium]